MDLFEKTLKEEYKYKGKTINLKVEEVQLPNGKVALREIVEHPGAVAIIPFLDDNTVVLVEQFRKSINHILIEIPAGKINKGEDIETCGIRELEEETGYKASSFQYLGKLAVAPGFADEIIYLYRAEGLYKGEINRDEDEFINVKLININELREMVRTGHIIDGKTVAALAYL